MTREKGVASFPLVLFFWSYFKMKKSLLAMASVSLLALSSNVSAALPQITVGLQVGSNSLSGTAGSSSGEADTPTETAMSFKSTLRKTHPSVGLFAGWDKTLSNNAMIGAELFFNHENPGSIQAEKSKEERTYLGAGVIHKSTIKAKLKNSFGLDIKTGYHWGSVLGYAKVGLSSGAFQVQNILAETTAASDHSSGKISKNKRVLGLRLGAGVDYKLNDRWNVGLAYTYTAFQAIKLSGNVTHTNVNGQGGSETYAVNANYKPRVHNVSLRVSYRFGA